MVISVTNSILGRMRGYTDEQRRQHSCHFMTLDIQVRLLITSWHEYVRLCCEVYAYVTLWSTS
jgi:hypothetical protein